MAARKQSSSLLPDAIARIAPPLPLSPLEQDEVRVFTLDTGDREQVRHAVRIILAALTCIPVGHISLGIGPRGKPYLANDRALFFSVSHSRGVSMIAVTRVADVGVDVEQARPVPEAEAILRRYFPHEDARSILDASDRDLRFVRAWTQAEARVKARGASVWEAATPDPTTLVLPLGAPADFAASIAVLAPADGTVRAWHVTQVQIAVSELLPSQQQHSPAPTDHTNDRP